MSTAPNSSADVSLAFVLKTSLPFIAIGVLSFYFSNIISDAHNAALARANQAPAFRHEECVHGVMYLALKQGVTVEYSPDNRVRTCTETK